MAMELSQLNKTSRLTTEGIRRAGNRSMMRAVGFTDEDFERPIVGVANLQSDITPCNVHLDRLVKFACEGIFAGGGVPQRFGAPTASDGIMMGHRGMKYSMVSRAG
jgi:dihydroxy-acid dehydratase